MIDRTIIEALFPAGGVPKTRYAGIGELRWFGNDDEERFLANPHPLLGRDDVVYRFNSDGYRSPEFHRGDINLMVLGDSFTFGTGLPEDVIYGAQVAKRLSEELGRDVRCWNLAMGGHSNDFIARTALSAIPALKPDLVLAMFTGPTRREYFAADGRALVYVPNRTHVPAREAAWTKEAHRLLDGLASPYQDAVNLAMNWSLTRLAAEAVGALFYFTAIDPRCLASIAHLCERSTGYLRRCIDKIDSARDHDHPGPRSHAAFASFIVPTILEGLTGRGFGSVGKVVA